MATPLRVAIVAGEASGDQLGAGLIQALRVSYPEAQIEAVAGPHMQAAGCDTLEDAAALAVMGLSEVLPEVARLWRLRRRLRQHWIDHPPDVFVGIDAPDFNLGLEKALRRAGIPTVHYVSPTVWAWRPGRVHTIAAAADTVLCLFPFEPACYAEVPIHAEYVGHPFARSMAQLPAPTQVRSQLSLEPGGPVLALVPGSRGGEVGQLLPAFLGAADQLRHMHPGLRVLIPAANAARQTQIQALCAGLSGQLDLRIIDGHMRECVRAADVALVTSGTATLETLLARTPMLVAYKASASTSFLMRSLGLLRTRHFSLPNILAARALVPEFVQEQVEPVALARALHVLLTNDGAREAQLAGFARVADSLLEDTNQLAAHAVLRTCGRA